MVGKVYFSLQVSSHNPSLTEVRAVTPGRRVEGGNEAAAPEAHCLFTGLLLEAFSFCFLIAPRTTCPEMASPQWMALVLQSLIKNIPSRLPPTGQSYGVIFSINTSSAHICLGLCHPDKTQPVCQLSITIAAFSAPCLLRSELLSAPPPHQEGWNLLEPWAPS